MWSVCIEYETGMMPDGVLLSCRRCERISGCDDVDAWYEERGGKTALDCRVATPSFLHQST